MAAPDDGSLVEQARAGAREAFGELVERHSRAMVAIARAYFAEEADAEDAVQDAFVKAFERLGQLDRPERLAAWLARITARTCIDTLRAVKHKVSLADFATSVPLRPRVGREHLTPASLASRGERAERLRAAIGRLKEPHRVVVMLRYSGAMSYAEIAAYLDVPITTVETRLHRAKRALRELLPELDTSAD